MSLENIKESYAPSNPDASRVFAESERGLVVYTVRDDNDGVVFASLSARSCVRYMRANDPDGIGLRCFTADGRPVSLLNVV